MAYTIAYIPSNKASDPVRHYFYADTFAELAGITEKIRSDIAYAVDTDLVYFYNGTVWDTAQAVSQKGAANGYAGLDADALASALKLENLTSDPASPVAGQIWLRTDL